MKQTQEIALSNGLPNRAIRTSALLMVPIALYFLLAGHYHMALGFISGAGISIVSLGTLLYQLPRMMKKRKMRSIYVSFIQKFVLYAVLIALLLSVEQNSVGLIIALCTGVMLVPTVIVLKAVGTIITGRENPIV